MSARDPDARRWTLRGGITYTHVSPEHVLLDEEEVTVAPVSELERVREATIAECAAKCAEVAAYYDHENRTAYTQDHANDMASRRDTAGECSAAIRAPGTQEGREHD